MLELDIGLVDGGKLHFDISGSLMQKNIYIYAKSSSQFDFKWWILDTAGLSS